jgi:uncharacterized membrane protein YkoI
MKTFTPIVLFLLFTFSVADLSSASDRNDLIIDQYMVQLERISMEEAVESALNAIPGKVIATDMEDGIYEIYIESEEGWISEVYVDPWDGSILKIKSKHRPVPPFDSKQ